MSITVPISVGEFIDKLTILEIKSERITDPEKRRNVAHELEGELALAYLWVCGGGDRRRADALKADLAHDPPPHRGLEIPTDVLIQPYRTVDHRAA